MDHTESRITVLDGFHDNTHGKQIIDLVEGLVLIDHLLIYTEEMLGASLHLGINMGIFQMLCDLCDDAIDKLFPLTLSEGDLFNQIVVNLRLQVF